MVRTFTAYAERHGSVPVTVPCTLSEGEEFRKTFEDLGYKVKVHAPSCPLASGFKCYEGCASACAIKSDNAGITYSCGATIRAA
jgi:hypothetical protein